MRRSILLGSLTLLTLAFGLAAAMGASGREGQAPSAAAAGPRVQLALGRVQLQEQRINNGIRRLDDLRAAVAAIRGWPESRRSGSIDEGGNRDDRTAWIVDDRHVRDARAGHRQRLWSPARRSRLGA